VQTKPQAKLQQQKTDQEVFLLSHTFYRTPHVRDQEASMRVW
jgi:hypothetical protein